MSFSFDESLDDDVSLVRFHIGDTNDEGHFLEDATIQYHVDAGSVETAAINCLRYIVTQLAQPNFKLDWLSVDSAEALRAYERLLRLKSQEFGIALLSPVTTISFPHRADSHENDDGSYDDPDGL
jgi:hypothetical protein